MTAHIEVREWCSGMPSGDRDTQRHDCYVYEVVAVGKFSSPDLPLPCRCQRCAGPVWPGDAWEQWREKQCPAISSEIKTCSIRHIVRRDVQQRRTSD